MAYTLEGMFNELINGRVFNNKGNTYYVELAANGGSDNNDGSKDNPFLTVNKAYDNCVDWNGDTIVVGKGTHSVDAAVECDVAGVTLIARQSGGYKECLGEGYTIAASADLDDDYVCKITAPTRIIGLGFAGRDLTKSSLIIDSDETGGFTGGFNELINCRFSCWYGALDYGLYILGGVSNLIKGCTFDGLFGGFDIAAIGLADDGALNPCDVRLIDNIFSGIGSGKHAIKCIGNPKSLIVEHNYLVPGIGAATGKMLDNDSKVSSGIIFNNVHGGANKAAMYENLTNSLLVFAGNAVDDS